MVARTSRNEANERAERMRGNARFGAVCAALLCAAPCLFAARAVPPLDGAVNDHARLLSVAERQELGAFLAEFDRQTDSQIAVLTVPSLEGEDIDSFALRVAESWKIGKAGTDSGVLLVVALQERGISIKTGYGAEGALTDAKCGLIIRNVLAPAFRDKRYSAGIISAAKTIAGVISGDAAEAGAAEAAEPLEESAVSPEAILVAIFFFIVFFSGFVNRIGSRRFGRGLFFVPLFLGGLGQSGSSGGHSPGGSSPRGFSGGGGRFGGGGASGKW